MKIFNALKARLLKYKPTLVGSLILILITFLYQFRNMLNAYLSVKLGATFMEGSFSNILFWGYVQCERMFGERGFAVETGTLVTSVLYIFYSLRFLPKSNRNRPFSPVTQYAIAGAGLLINGWNFLWGGRLLDKQNGVLFFIQLLGVILLLYLYLGMILILLSDLIVFVLTLLF